jgi:hypothetical protein
MLPECYVCAEDWHFWRQSVINGIIARKKIQNTFSETGLFIIFAKPNLFQLQCM